jgi:multidrug efflux pump subunit AcrA (membrane-fusion protein)
LWAQQVGTQDALEQRELAYKNSTTAYETAMLKYRDLKKQLNFAAKQSQKNVQITATISDDYTITSKINGKVYDILKENGEMVTTQSPVAIIGDADSFYLELQVDEYDIAKIKLGQKTMLTLDSYKGQNFEAIISKIDPIMDEQSRSFTIEATFTKQPQTLYPNLTTEANILIQTKQKVLTIPRNYLIDDTYVMMENKEKRKVNIGLKDYQRVEILSGITADDFIINPKK